MKAITKPLTIYFNPEVYENVQLLAKKKQWSFTKTVNNVLQDYITSETTNNQGK